MRENSSGSLERKKETPTPINTNGEEDEKPRVRDSVGSAVLQKQTLLLRAAGGDEPIRDVISHPLLGGDYCLRHSRQEDEEGKVFFFFFF